MASNRRPGFTTGEVDALGSSDRAAIPASAEGYAVDPFRGLLHRRYAGHARGLPRARSAAQVRTYLGDAWRACPECWPPARAAVQAPAATPVKARRSRRTEPDATATNPAFALAQAERDASEPPSADRVEHVRMSSWSPEAEETDDETAPEFGMQALTRGVGDESTPEEPEA